MKIPLQWLRDYVALDIPVAELVERLNRTGLEVASVRTIGLPVPEGLRSKVEQTPLWDRDKIMVARVLRVEKHPDADKLKLPTVDYGQGRTKTMVTGAPNIKVGDSGQKVVLGLSGSVLYDGHATPKVLKELKPAKIRGVPSDAMLCSELELGITEEHEGIIFLEDDAPVGTPLADFMGDIVLEIDILPNMARCLSMIGVAREVAAITSGKLTLPTTEIPDEGEPIEGQVRVEIEDPQLSCRYACALLRGISVQPAPKWMQRRLTYAGMRPINNIVDITNYVMLEWGQPLHAFDHDVLRKRAGGKAPTIIVRPAREGEVLKTLDGVDRKLTPEMLVIADTAGPIALAGVMGGAETEVTESTSNVLLESANFDFVSIRRTMRHFNLPSEASARFSRGVHPELVRPAALRAADLMRQYAGATVCAGLVDSYPAPPEPRRIDLSRGEVKRILGVDISLEECLRYLRGLQYDVEKLDEGTLRVLTPPHRLDIQEGPADLIEDIARLYGYDRLPATLLADRLPAQATNAPLQFEEQVRDLLVNLGLQEVITYSLTTREQEAKLGKELDGYVTLLNPINNERVDMRQRLLPSVLDRARENLKYTGDVRMFEVGTVYLPREGQRLPDEQRRVAMVMLGNRHPDYWGDADRAPAPLDFFDLKGVVEGMVDGLHLTAVRYGPGDASELHPARSAALIAADHRAGSFGQLHPRVAQAMGFADRQVFAAEFDLEFLAGAVPERHLYRPISIYEVVLQDIAVVIPEEMPAERVTGEIRQAGGDLLRKVSLFDVYRGESIPAGKKSLAFALTYQASDRTLSDKEVAKTHEKIERHLVHKLGAQIRGKES
jgi:phenylalanyl-tRNA synthetase beta chain